MSPGPVSRTAELAAVADLLNSARSGPAALFLEGEPGIGKTTVWLAALASAREGGFRVLTTHPAEAESVLSYAALADLLSGVDAAQHGRNYPTRSDSLWIESCRVQARPAAPPTPERSPPGSYRW